MTVTQLLLDLLSKEDLEQGLVWYITLVRQEFERRNDGFRQTQGDCFG